MTHRNGNDDALGVRLRGALTEVASLAPALTEVEATVASVQVRSRRSALSVAGAAALAALAIGVPAFIGFSGGDDHSDGGIADDSVVPTEMPPDPGPRSTVDRVSETLVGFESEVGYGRTIVDYEAGQVTLLWKGRVPKTVQDAIDGAPASVSVVVRAAPYSMGELTAAGLRVLEASQEGRWPTTVVAVVPAKDLSGVVVAALKPAAIPLNDLALVARVPATVDQGGTVKEFGP